MRLISAHKIFAAISELHLRIFQPNSRALKMFFPIFFFFFALLDPFQWSITHGSGQLAAALAAVPSRIVTKRLGLEKFRKTEAANSAKECARHKSFLELANTL